MVIFDCILDQQNLKIQVQYLQCYIVLLLHKRGGNKRSDSRLRAIKQKQMLDVTKKNYPKISFLKNRIVEGKNNLKVKTAFHMSSKYNNGIDRTQNTNEENGRQATRGDGRRTKLYSRLPRFCR